MRMDDQFADRVVEWAVEHHDPGSRTWFQRLLAWLLA